MPLPSEKVLMSCEIEHEDLLVFIAECDKEDKSVGDLLADIIQKFLAKGDNHPLRKSA